MVNSSVIIGKAAGITHLLPIRPALLGWLVAVIGLAALWFGSAGLNTGGRLTLVVFGLAVAGWVLTDLDDTYVALSAMALLMLAGVSDAGMAFSTLGHPMIWLLAAASIIAAGVNASGLMTRLTGAMIARTGSITTLFFSLMLLILGTAFVIPATSGRAALMLPVFVAISKAVNSPQISKALALLFPTTILLSAVAALTGAGAHLVTADIVAGLGGETLTMGRWMVLGLPFALASCVLSTLAILRLFLTPQQRSTTIYLGREQVHAADGMACGAQVRRPLTGAELYVLSVVALLLALWAGESFHSLNSGLVALLGALAMTLPAVKLLKFKQALKAVDWNMLLFMAASIQLGEALVASGAGEWLVSGAFGRLAAGGAGPLALVGAVALISLLAHLAIHSRTARSTVLVPLVVLVGSAGGYNPVALAFLSTAAAGFCLTLPVSAKAVAMFAGVDAPTYTPRDLLKLSAVLLPLHLLLLLLFAFVVWPALGMPLL